MAAAVTTSQSRSIPCDSRLSQLRTRWAVSIALPLGPLGAGSLCGPCAAMLAGEPRVVSLAVCILSVGAAALPELAVGRRQQKKRAEEGPSRVRMQRIGLKCQICSVGGECVVSTRWSSGSKSTHETSTSSSSATLVLCKDGAHPK